MSSQNTFKIIHAKTFKQRLFGLITTQLTPNQGLLFKNASSLHTYFMRYDLDILFLDANGKIIKIVKNIKPWRFSLCLKAKHFIEIPSQSEVLFDIGDVISLN